MSRSLRTRPTTLYGTDFQGGPSNSTVRVARKAPPSEPDSDDKVRHRLSRRYASSAAMPAVSYMSGLNRLAPVAGSTPLEFVAEENAPPVPPLPALPTAVGLGAVVSPEAPAVERWEAHAAPGISGQEFADENFSPHAFVAAQVAQQSETGLRSLRATLESIQTTTQRQLKEQVFMNYAQFINISREIATLENDMLEFKELLGEWKQLPQQLHLQDTDDHVMDSDALMRHSLKRGSVADLESIYKAQLASLWENIEGSQKFVPYVPGRHVIAETSQFVEINSATYKTKQAVSLFLLDDLLLVATQRARHYGHQTYLVAERCFNLSEIVVVDLKDTKDVHNAIKIKRGKESVVYRTDRAQDKRALLRAFRSVGEALSAKMKKERMARAQSRRNASGDPVLGDALDPTLQLDDATQRSDARVADVQALGTWLHQAVDDLSMHIALREWDVAVALVEDGKARLAKQPVSEGPLYLLVENFTACANSLVSAISAELVSSYQRKSVVVHDAALLVRLDKGREARDLLLEARADLLRRRTRQIRFEGDTSLYISELAMLYFTLIKNTGDWYMAAFKDYKMASGTLITLTTGFVQWASDQIRSYAETFRRQVYGANQDPRIVQEAKDITRKCAQILNDVGLGLNFLLSDLLEPDSNARVPILPTRTAPDSLTSRERRPYEWHSVAPE